MRPVRLESERSAAPHENREDETAQRLHKRREFPVDWKIQDTSFSERGMNMELVKKILDYVLESDIDDEMIATLQVARKLIANLDSYYAKMALEAIFGGEDHVE
jgi:hypothetical protein